MEFKKTGIVRRIDDLGRIVIPKELRRTLRIHEGDAFELGIIEIDGKKSFVATPYSPTENRIGYKAAEIANTIKRVIGGGATVFIADAFNIYPCTIGKNHPVGIYSLFRDVECTKRPVNKDIDGEMKALALPIIDREEFACNNDVVAALIVIAKQDVIDNNYNTLQYAVKIVESMM